MIHRITIDDFISSKQTIPLADVRTPAEFEQGHIPGAFNLPLFSNEERVVVGTTYKQAGREAAILLGFDLTGPKWSQFIKQSLEAAPQKKIALHCWRGGMRSGAMAWALDLYGFEVYLIEGGYKKFRNWTLQQFEISYPIVILGGLTGSGKTRILHQLRELGEPIIDLEELAQHQGSSYGTMNKLVQPTQEQFENDLAWQLQQIDRTKRVWVENESSSIGKRIIPRPFWNGMTAASIVDINVPAEQRVEALAKEYGALDKDFLIECTERIERRLGPDQAKKAIAAIREDRMADFIQLVLVYYDKTYRTGLSMREASRIFSLSVDTADPRCNAAHILNFIRSLPEPNFAP